jgi:sterol desaturase/sphingolipid hydroxylase (fatty acid hydroxylase superfamily)
MTDPSHFGDRALTGAQQTVAMPNRAGLVVGLIFVAALVVALLTRGNAVVGIAVLFLLFVPIEKLFALRPQKVFRRGFVTDLTHLLANNLLVAGATIAFIAVAAIPLFWVRRIDLQGMLPASVAIAIAVPIVFLGNYWGHRLTHTVPFLWRFHAVHHSIAEMDWVASGRLHPLDSGFTQACTVLPLFLLGYTGGAFAGVTVAFTLLALFIHANTRLRFPGLRWVINTPEWHHWHHASDPEARDKNFGLPVIDKLFGTAYMPKGKHPTGFGIDDPVPVDNYLRHLAYPFTRAARGQVGQTSETVQSSNSYPSGTPIVAAAGPSRSM